MIFDDLPSSIAAARTGAEYDQVVRDAYEARFPIQDGVSWSGEAYTSEVDIDGADRANHGFRCFRYGVSAASISFLIPSSPYELGTPEDAERSKVVIELAKALTSAGVNIENAITQNQFRERP